MLDWIFINVGDICNIYVICVTMKGMGGVRKISRC